MTCIKFLIGLTQQGIQFVFQMIYPKKQFEMPTGAQELKKEALELIISLYLNRETNQEMKFLQENFGRIEELAEGIRTSMADGLNEKKVLSNRILYGQNENIEPKKSRKLGEIVADQFLSPYYIITFFLVMPAFIYGFHTDQIYYKYSSSMVYTLINLGAAVRTIISYVFCRKLKKVSIDKNKSTTYCVRRNGKLVEIEESQIVVGDIIRLGFREEVPASGIVISDTNIFVKEGFEENGDDRIQNKNNLFQCQRKLQSMSSLDMKMAFEQQTFPSPVILRGSQLVQGPTYWVMVLTVTQEQMLKQKGFQKKDIFISESYDEWASALVQKWNYTAGFILIFATIFLCFSRFGDAGLYKKKGPQVIQLILNVTLIIAMWSSVLHVNTLKAFLEVYFVKVIVSLQVSQKLEKLLSVEKIICNETNISESDKIIVQNIAVGEKKDILYTNQFQKLDTLTSAIVKEILSVFDLAGEENEEDSQDIQKCSRMVHVNKKKLKVISRVVQKNKGTGLLKSLFKEIVKINDEGPTTQDLGMRRIQPKVSLKLRKSVEQNPRTFGLSVLSVPKIGGSEEEDLEQILHNRCRVKSRGLINQIVNIAQKGYRTYYFQAFEAEKLKETTHIIINGKIEPLLGENRQRMSMMGRQLQVIFGLTPIMIGYNEGAYNQKSMKILVAILGITISEDNKIINYLNQFDAVGIKSVITIGKSMQENQHEEEVMQEYRDRKWLKMVPNELFKMDDIRKKLGRLVCGDCLIANCDCKNKIMAVSNVQPFLNISSTARIIYNVEEEDYQYLESSCNQLRYGYLCIQSQNSYALRTIEALNNTLLFVEGLRRSIILLYFIPFLFFVPQFVFFLRGIQLFQTRQITLLALLYHVELFLILYVGLEIPARDTKKFQRDKIEIINKQSTLFLIILTILLTIMTQLMFYHSYLIPEYPDGYDDVMEKYGMDPSICKYASNGGVANTYQRKLCSIADVTGKGSEQSFSRLSTLVNIYIQICLALVVILKSRNFKSRIVLSEYILCVGTIVMMVFQMHPHFCLYRFYLTWQHWIIVTCLALITCLLAWVFSHVLAQSGLSEYFQDELASKIILSKEDDSHYSRVLKEYHNMNKSKKEKELLFPKTDQVVKEVSEE